jgi:hypothetical protein
MQIDSSGNLGIGTSTPDTTLHVDSGTVNNVAKFHSTDSTASIYLTDGSTTGGDTGVQGLITTGDNLQVRGLNKVILATGTTDRMTIDSSGNVGIGEAAPATLLHLSANNAGITTAGTGNNTLRFEDKDPTKIGSQVTGTIDWYTNDADATGVQAWITADSTNVGAGSLAFGTGVAGATAERLRIDSSGNVGIGAITVDSQLHIEKSDITAYNGSATDGQLSAGATAFVQQTGASNNAISQIVFQPRSGFGYNRIVNSGGSAPYMALTTNNSEAIRINASGNVGIGTAAPAQLLQVGDGASGTSNTIRIEGRTTGGEQEVATLEFNQFSSLPVEFIGASLSLRSDTGRSNSALVFNVSQTPNTSATEAMRIDRLGNVSVGTSTNPGYRLSLVGSGTVQLVNRTGSDGTAVLFQNDGVNVGTISVTGSATAYNTSSDYRLKENITPVQGAADIVKAMQPVTYTFKSDGSWHDGFLAHELQELHPRAVVGEKDAMVDEEYEVTPAVYEDVIIPAVDAVVDEDGNVTQEAQLERTEQRLVSEAVMGTRSVPDHQGVDYSKLTPILTAALQEALNKIDALEARLTALEGTV